MWWISKSSDRGPSWCRWALVIGLVLGGLLLPAPTGAQEEDGFQLHYDRALAAYKAKNYAETVRELSAAYTIRPVPALLLNLGHAHLDQGQGERALFYYDRYLKEESNLTPKARADVARYQEAARRLAAMETRGVPVEPPREPPPQAQTQVQTQVQTQAQQQPKAARGNKRGLLVSGLTLLGGGVAVTVTGVVLGVLAQQTAQQIVMDPGPFDAGLDARGRALDAAGISLDVLGGVLVLSGGVLTFASMAEPRRGSR